MTDCAVAAESSIDLERTLAQIELALGSVSLGLVRFYLLLATDPDIAYERAAERLGVDMRSVRRYEKTLVSHGFLEVGRIRGKDGTRIHRILHRVPVAPAAH